LTINGLKVEGEVRISVLTRPETGQNTGGILHEKGRSPPQEQRVTLLLGPGSFGLFKTLIAGGLGLRRQPNKRRENTYDLFGLVGKPGIATLTPAKPLELRKLTGLVEDRAGPRGGREVGSLLRPNHLRHM